MKIKVEDPTPYGLFLGCRHEIGEVFIGPKRQRVRTMTYNVESYLQKSVEAYLSLLPQGSKLKKVATPFLSTAVGPNICDPVKTGTAYACPWCKGCFHESEFEELNPRTMLPKANASCKGQPLASGKPIQESLTRGALADKAGGRWPTRRLASRCRCCTLLGTPASICCVPWLS